MAKSIKSTLPKVISKANKDISTIIEGDIAKESALLKDLVDQVLKANLEVKKKNNQRITETKRKLQELDDQIEDLNTSIDAVDRETVIEQLNEMIDAENKIFNAKREIRFFDHVKMPSRIDSLEQIFTELTASVGGITPTEERYRDTLLSQNDILLQKQISITNFISQAMKDIINKKKENLNQSLDNISDIKQSIANIELSQQQAIASTINECNEMNASSKAIFTDHNNDEEMNQTVHQNHQDAIIKNKEQKITLQEQYQIDKTTLIESYQTFVREIEQKVGEKNQQILLTEKQEHAKIEEQLKMIRFDIMDAEKKGNYQKVASLLKKFEKVEKSVVSKATTLVSKETNELTNKQYTKTVKQLQAIETKYVTDIHHLEYEEAFENIRFEEAKILFQINNDYAALQEAQTLNHTQITMMKKMLQTRLQTSKQLYDFKLQVRTVELEIMKQNELFELELIETYKQLLYSLTEVVEKRRAILSQTLSTQKMIQVEQEYNLNKAILDMKLDQELHDIDKQILQKRNETLIHNEKLKEELSSDIIYQESLIKIAQKEHELQLIKVKSLYENERSLAEEQVERINLGIQVNDTFVKTTLQNQMLFATQQINCADSEFEIRIESINLTHDQEVQYANKKIEYYRQRYEYEKSKIRKELDDKLEDLNYKLLLFTEQKDSKELHEKIQKLKDHYEGLIDEIEAVEQQDEEIIRYEKVISDADRRADSAIEEATALKEQTVMSFETLLQATKEKFNLIEETDQTESTKGIMPLLNSSAISSADERLQNAIKEADQLYQERITNPTKMIQETKERIIEMTASDDTETFINEHKEHKKNKMKEYKEASDILLETFNQQRNQVQQIIQTDVKVVIDETSLFQNLAYRESAEIIKDYDVLVTKEKILHKQYIEDIKHFVQTKTSELDQHLKIMTKQIKTTFKPYRKYIKIASKGITASKKDLSKEFDKLLAKRLNDALKQLKENMPI